MTNEEKLALFDELIVASGQLATVADNFAVTLSVDFERGIRTQVDNVKAILAKCPAPEGVWDGTIREGDLTITVYQSEPQRQRNLGRQSVKVTHSITGISRASETRTTEDENRKIAMQALEKAVRERFAQMQRQGRA